MRQRFCHILYCLVVSVFCLLPADCLARSEAPSGEPHQQLQSILEQPAYQRWDLRQHRGEGELVGDDQKTAIRLFIEDIAISVRDFVSSAWDRVVAFFKKIFGNVNPPAINAPDADWEEFAKLAAYVAAGILILLLIYLVYRVYKQGYFAMPRRTNLTREQIDSAMHAGEALAMQSTDWLTEADHQAQAGNFRLVYRALYLALLAGLHEMGRIEFRRSRTNWTYVNRFKGPDAHRSMFAGLTDTFDDVWYGHQDEPTGGESLPQLRANVKTLIDGKPTIDTNSEGGSDA